MPQRVWRSLAVLDDVAPSMAVLTRKPKPGLIHHSDRGRRYTSLVYGALCHRHGIVTSMGKAGDCYDNAMAESFFATLECELLDRHRFRTRAEARTVIFKFIEGFYNRRRVHSALGYLSPENCERRHALTGIGKLQTVH